VHILKRYSSKL